MITLLQSHFAAAVPRTEARVAAPVTRAAEDTALPRPHDARASKPGDLPHVDSLSLGGLGNSSVKRAYLRACRRAPQQGHTHYRGRTLTAQEVPVQPLSCAARHVVPKSARQVP